MRQKAEQLKGRALAVLDVCVEQRKGDRFDKKDLHSGNITIRENFERYGMLAVENERKLLKEIESDEVGELLSSELDRLESDHAALQEYLNGSEWSGVKDIPKVIEETRRVQRAYGAELRERIRALDQSAGGRSSGEEPLGTKKMILKKGSAVETEWKKLRFAFDHYRKYLESEKQGDTCDLSITDLAYVRTLKKGDSPFGQIPTDKLKEKCRELGNLLVPIRDAFEGKRVEDLDEEGLLRLSELGRAVVGFKGIKGFREARLSALLHCHFPELFPMMDKNVEASLFDKEENTVDRFVEIVKKVRSGIRRGDRENTADFDRHHWCKGKQILQEREKQAKAAREAEEARKREEEIEAEVIRRLAERELQTSGASSNEEKDVAN